MAAHGSSTGPGETAFFSREHGLWEELKAAISTRKTRKWYLRSAFGRSKGGFLWLLEAETATQCDDRGVFSLVAQVSMAFADWRSQELSKAIMSFAFPEVSWPRRGARSWACQVSPWELSGLIGGACDITATQGRPSWPRRRHRGPAGPGQRPGARGRGAEAGAARAGGGGPGRSRPRPVRLSRERPAQGRKGKTGLWRRAPQVFFGVNIEKTCQGPLALACPGEALGL